MSRPALPLGTVRPGPRGYGWRVKAAGGKNGWVPCDEFGNHLAVAPARRTLVEILERNAAGPSPHALARQAASSKDREARSTRAAAGRLSRPVRAVLEAIGHASRYGNGATYLELALWLDAHPGSVSKRLVTLRDAGLIHPSSKRDGKAVYTVTDKAEAI